MTTILALTDTPNDVRHFCDADTTLLFTIRPLPPGDHTYARFEQLYDVLRASCDLSSVDVVIAEHVESLPLLYFMRRDGYSCPALMIPHANPYPLHILFRFLLIAEYAHPGDLVICGSRNAARAYERLTGIRAENICTFGIGDAYRGKDRAECRSALALPRDRKILLYTGRFMNDKGLESLLSGYRLLRRADPRVLLVMAVTHIDPPYYNRLAPGLGEAILFHRLERERTVELYNAADLFVSGSTSVFETYGKSPLEALACGTPAVVPRWEGFPHCVDEGNGGLVDVEYLSRPVANPFEFARMCAEDFAAVCGRVLDRTEPWECRAPDWARYETTMKILPDVIAGMAAAGRTTTAPRGSHLLDVDRYPDSVRAVLDCYGLKETADLLHKADRLGLLDQSSPGEEALLRDLHHDLFGVTDAGPRTG